LLTLYTTPVIYLAFDRLGRWSIFGRKQARPGTESSGELPEPPMEAESP
jgi:hypothetical protein